MYIFNGTYLLMYIMLECLLMSMIKQTMCLHTSRKKFRASNKVTLQVDSKFIDCQLTIYQASKVVKNFVFHRDRGGNLIYNVSNPNGLLKAPSGVLCFSCLLLFTEPTVLTSIIILSWQCAKYLKC